MADNILVLNMPLASSKCLFEIWLLNKGVIDNKIAMIVMQCRIIRKMF